MINDSIIITHDNNPHSYDGAVSHHTVIVANAPASRPATLKEHLNIRLVMPMATFKTK